MSDSGAPAARVPFDAPAALALSAALVVGVDMLGHPAGYGLHWRTGAYLNAKLAGAVLLVVGWLAVLRLRRAGPLDVRGLAALPAAVFIVTALSLPPPLAGVLVASAIGFACAAWWPHPRVHQVGFAVAVAAGVAARAASFARVTVGAAGGDMVPLLIRASDRLLAGQSPYAVYEMPWKLPLTYLPGSFLPCVPLRLVGVDVRWAFVAAHLATGALLLRGSWQTRARLLNAPVACLWLTFFLAPGSSHFDTLSNSGFAWTAITLVVAACVAWPRGRGWAAGAALATTPLAGPVWAVTLAAQMNDARSAKRAGIDGLRSFALFAVALLPWLVWDEPAFVAGTVTWFNDLQGFPAEKWEVGRTWSRFVGFAGLFWTWGQPAVLRAVQCAGVAVVAAAAWRCRARANAAAPFALLAFAWFMLWNPVVWPYLLHGLMPLTAACWLPKRAQPISSTV